MKQRIWELDAARGLCLILMVGFHLWYDLVYLFGLVPLRAAWLFRLITGWGNLPFLLICGICATLGKYHVRRGLQVLGGGLLISAVTVGLFLAGFSGREVLIYFGVLHCLGSCMLLWPLLRKLPSRALAVLSIIAIALGLWLRYRVRVNFPWLIPLGIVPWDFASADFFPLLPCLGYFLVGALAGRKFYAHRQTLLPQVSPTQPIIRFFTFFGRHSLAVYLLHQPVLFALVSLWILLF